MMQRSIPLADRFPFAPRRWSRLLAGVAVALTLVSSAPAEALYPTAVEYAVILALENPTFERDEQLQEEVLDVLELMAENPVVEDINCDEGVDGDCHYTLCCNTSTGNCSQLIMCGKAGGSEYP